MSQPPSSAAPRQLHTLLPGLHGAHACLTLYDVCPHTACSTPSHLREPYLHYNLPALPSRQTIAPANERDREVCRTTQTTLSRMHLPKEKALAASLAPLVLSRHSPVMHHIRASTREPTNPLRSILKPPHLTTSLQALPTVHILTFSTDRTPTTKAFAELLNTHLPPRIPLLYTIDARDFRVPPARICERYSGVAKLVQDAVVQDARAREEVAAAVDELVRFVRADRGAGRAVSLAVCCTAGTHRSVALAELIALGVREEIRRADEMGVKVVVRHVHRVRGPKDPY